MRSSQTNLGDFNVGGVYFEIIGVEGVEVKIIDCF